MNACDKLLREAFEDVFSGVELNYKLDDVVNRLPKGKLTKEQLNGYLLKQGVSPKEIEASKLLSVENSKPISNEDWKSMLGSSHKLNKLVYQANDAMYDNVTLGMRGEDNPTYKVNEYFTDKLADGETNLKHTMDDKVSIKAQQKRSLALKEHEDKIADLYKVRAAAMNKPEPDEELIFKLTRELADLKRSLPRYKAPYQTKSQLGWNRVHTDNINGKDVTVLNELQSDWMQAERQGAGYFKSRYPTTISNEELDELAKPYVEELNRGNISAQREEELVNLIDELRLKAGNVSPIIDDFPIKPEKFQQLMIVDAINEAIENGTNKIVIPINREGQDLAGTEGVTAFYKSLDRKVLPEIQKKLDKQGLKLKLGKEDMSVEPDLDDIIDVVIDNLEYKLGDESALQNVDRFELFDTIRDVQDLVGNKPDTFLDKLRTTLIEDYPNEVDSIFSTVENSFKSMKGTSNTLHTIEIVEKPNSAVKWDVYGLLGALGLSEAVKEEKGI